jgi:tetratricopeptide (TPR) repeat protein
MYIQIIEENRKTCLMVIFVEYIIITILAISATTFIVYKLANSIFGLQIQVRPLILCAGCALLISLVLPRVVVGYAGLAGTFGFLAIFAIIFAYFVAYYDDTSKPQPLEINEPAGSEVKCCALLPVQQNIDVALAETTSIENNAVPLIKIPKAGQEAVAQLVSSKIIAEALDESSSGKSVIQEIADESSKEELDEMIILAECEGEKDKAMLPEQDIIPANMQCMTVQLDLSANNIEIPQPISNSLDDLMDFAFTQKEQQNFALALSVFRQALQLYPDSESAPFLVIEIGNILKNKGAYDEAIKIFTDGRNLLFLHANNMLEQEFVSTVAYLRIIKNILLQNRLGLIPFNNIPTEILEEINAEFREWRNLV